MFLSWFRICPEVKKLLRGHRAFFSYLGLKFSLFQPQKNSLLLYPYSKVTGLTNFELSQIANQEFTNSFGNLMVF